MLLCHHSKIGSNAVRKASPSGQAFVACVVVLMLLSVFSEAWELAALEVEVFATDVAVEFLATFGLRHWDLLELVLAGVALTLGIGALKSTGIPAPKSVRSADGGPPDKIPI